MPKFDKFILICDINHSLNIYDNLYIIEKCCIERKKINFCLFDLLHYIPIIYVVITQ